MTVLVPALAAAILGIVLPAVKSWKIAIPIAILVAGVAFGFSGAAPAAIVLAVGIFAFEAAALARNVRAGDALAIAIVYTLLAFAFGSIFFAGDVFDRMAETPDSGPAIQQTGRALLAVNPYAAIATSLGKDPLRQDEFYARFRAADFLLLAPRWTETLAIFGGLAALFALHRLLTRRPRAAPRGACGA